MTRLRKVFIFSIKCYQWTISPWLGKSCRFGPTCSHYATEAIEELGVIKVLSWQPGESFAAIAGVDMAIIQYLRRMRRSTSRRPLNAMKGSSSISSQLLKRSLTAPFSVKLFSHTLPIRFM